jgi:periplasmic protein TonB
MYAKNNVHPMFIKEAIRVLRKMPNWVPATVDGKNVPMFFSLPVNFALSN